MVENGWGAPYAKIITASGTVLDTSRFSYVHSEKLDDSSKITFETGNLSLVDNPELHEGSRLVLVWGYTGSEKIRSHIVYVWDSKPSFDATGLRMELVCYCKAAYLSLASGKDIYNGMSVEDVAKQFAESVGLNYKDELKKSINGDYLDVVQTGGKTQAELDWTTQKKTVARDETDLRIDYVSKKYPEGFAQAGDSPAKLLSEMINAEPTGNMVIDGRDDDLILRVRDFSQVPIRSYTFRGEPGYLLAVAPGSRNDQFKKEGISNNVTGWDEENKEFIEGEINRTHSTAEVLSNTITITNEQAIKDQVRKDMENLVDRPVSIGGIFQEEYEGTDDNGNKFYKKKVVQKLDSTKTAWVHFVKRGTRPATLDLQKNQMMAAIDNTTLETSGFIPVTPKELIRTIETKKEDIAGQGVNRQSEKELAIYQGTADIIGDVDLESSKVIQLLGIGIKYSGNYYIESVTHEITPENGYICYLSILRTGYNQIGQEISDKVKASTYNIPYNNKNINNTESVKDLPKNLLNQLVKSANHQAASTEIVHTPLKKIKKKKPTIPPGI